MSLLSFAYLFIIFRFWCTVAVRCELVCCTTSTTILQNADQLVNFADWLISDRERHFCPSWSKVFRVKEPSRSPICYGSKMCLKLGHISASIYMIRHFVAGLQISRRGKSKELRANLGLLTKVSFAAAIAFIPTKKRRRRASSNTLNHPFEVHGGSGKKAVVFCCRYSSSCETCQIVASLLDREGTFAPDLPQA